MIRRSRLATITAFALAATLAVAARAEDLPTAAIPAAARPSSSHPFPPSGVGRAARATPGSGGWWLAPTGIVLALAGFGALSVAARRFLPRAEPAAKALRVIGRTPLTAKHTVHLVRAGDRVLLIGTGPQGAPTLLGELDEAETGGPA